MTVWRLQTNTDSQTGLKIADYCLENKVLAMGWSLKDKHLEEYLSADLQPSAILERNNIATFEDYASFLAKFDIYGGQIDSNINRLYYDIKENDLIWIRTNGIYYLGRVTEKSRWIFNNSQLAYDLDASNQITNIEWHKIGDESAVPGAITTALIRGHTLQRINKIGVLEFSQILYNEKAGSAFYSDVQLENSSDMFYSLLSPDDCEDLLCLWLYARYGYIVIPSTNKKATECYECVLKDPKTGQSIFPQVKAGEVDLFTSDYCHLNGEVWLFTTKGRVLGENVENIHTANPNVLYEFVGSDLAHNILSSSILLWYEKLNNV